MSTDFSVQEYPLPLFYQGGMLGNSILGLFAWGRDDLLHLSIGSSLIWDHRGGMHWSPKQNYADIRHALEARDEEAIREIFRSDTENVPGQPRRPSLIPIGRADLRLASGARLLRNELNRTDGCLTVVYSLSGQERAAQIRLDMENKGLLAIRCSDLAEVQLLPSFETTGTEMADRGFAPPSPIHSGAVNGFRQEMPAPDDPAFGLAWRLDNGLLTFRFARGETQLAELSSISPADWTAIEQENRAWWTAFWADVPTIQLANHTLEDIYRDGLFKFASMTSADGFPAGLQGPFIEDNHLPPWSGDYHFNINVEIMYWPGFRAGLFPNLRRLFDMVLSWRPLLRQNARYYLGLEDGYMLPHAVDDHCTCMGSFWTGTIDHACTAWIATMMFDYCDYAGDMEWLRSDVFDFMKGAFKVFYAMLERHGNTLTLPVSISPEYRGAEMNAWGANASFQLASIHCLTRDLISAAKMLELPVEPTWLEVERDLPLASLVKDNQGRDQIALWEGLPLEESHRHHSHLAGLCPFDIFDQDAPQWKSILQASLEQWIVLGTGLWDGWGTTWAAMLHSHADQPDAAEYTLLSWQHQFTDHGGSLHDSHYPGTTIWTGRPFMQMDGTMGALTAVQDMLLHARGETIHLFAGIPASQRTASFQKMRAPGGFIISASRQTGYEQTGHVEVTATRDSTLKLAMHGISPRQIAVTHAGKTETLAYPDTVACQMKAGETAVIDYR